MSKVIPLFTDPQLAAAEYMQAVYDVPLSDLQKREITRAFAAGMLQASTVFTLCLSTMQPEESYATIEVMQEQLSDFCLATLKERADEKAAKAAAAQQSSKN
ncbi:MAG: hypothetical protein M0Q93_00110 [Terrimicrobiaceae bacterium]|jgi:hypothetical protein|nr:hypothetical protein [Terrimicrobiaceae bacterium]